MYQTTSRDKWKVQGKIVLPGVEINDLDSW